MVFCIIKFMTILIRGATAPLVPTPTFNLSNELSYTLRQVQTAFEKKKYIHVYNYCSSIVVLLHWNQKKRRMDDGMEWNQRISIFDDTSRSEITFLSL